MEALKFYLVIGVFFQEKDRPAIGFDPEIGERAMMLSFIDHSVFSGVIDTSRGIGAFQDEYGMSEIEISSFKKDFETQISKLSFLKNYPTHTLSYELFSEEKKEDSLCQEWIGKWTFQEESGLVKMKTIEIDKKIFFDYKSIKENKLFLEYFPEEDPESLFGYEKKYKNSPNDNTDTNKITEGESNGPDDLPF